MFLPIEKHDINKITGQKMGRQREVCTTFIKRVRVHKVFMEISFDALELRRKMQAKHIDRLEA